jgi:LIM domain kinase 1
LVWLFLIFHFFSKILFNFKDYIAGGTLKNLIHDLSIPLTWLQRLRYAKDIASGMVKLPKMFFLFFYYLDFFFKEYLHLCNIIHRDLNSSNCLVKSDGQVVVADFGLSRINLDDDDDVTTQNNDGSSASYRREQRSTSTTITSNGNIVVVRPKTRRQILRDRQR